MYVLDILKIENWQLAKEPHHQILSRVPLHGFSNEYKYYLSPVSKFRWKLTTSVFSVFILDLWSIPGLHSVSSASLHSVSYIEQHWIWRYEFISIHSEEPPWVELAGRCRALGLSCRQSHTIILWSLMHCFRGKQQMWWYQQPHISWGPTSHQLTKWYAQLHQAPQRQ